MKNLFDIQGKVIVVTGGGGVLCGKMARALGRAGARVAILDLFEAAAGKVADQIAFDGGTAIAVKCNVLDKASIVEARKKVVAATAASTC